jgi:HK97 gp10 family phage protein
MGFNVEVKGLKELERDMKRAGGNAKPLIKAALFNSSREIQKNVRREAPHRTGALQGHVLTEIDYPQAIVSVDEKYGEFVEYGTRPHLIRPKNKKALFWKGALSPYAVVKHPGTKANPFFKRGFERSENYVKNQFTAVIDRLVRELAGKA